MIGRPVRVCTAVLDRKFTGTASTAFSSWVALSSSTLACLASESYIDSRADISHLTTIPPQDFNRCEELHNMQLSIKAITGMLLHL